MIVAIVKMSIPKELGYDEFVRHAEEVAPNFENLPGLVRKNFLYNAEEGIAGGAYLWESREAAEECYKEDGIWRQRIESYFHVVPEITYYDSPVTTDNSVGKILKSVA